MSSEDPSGASKESGRVPPGAWFMLGIFVVGLIALFVLGNVEGW
jgi:hypothetical protein